jgi:hypothetical protein
MKPEIIKVSSAWTKAHFSNLTNWVASYGKTAIVTKFDKPAVAIVPLRLLPKKIRDMLKDQTP